MFFLTFNYDKQICYVYKPDYVFVESIENYFLSWGTNFADKMLLQEGFFSQKTVSFKCFSTKKTSKVDLVSFRAWKRKTDFIVAIFHLSTFFPSVCIMETTHD